MSSLKPLGLSSLLRSSVCGVAWGSSVCGVAWAGNGEWKWCVGRVKSGMKCEIKSSGSELGLGSGLAVRVVGERDRLTCIRAVPPLFSGGSTAENHTGHFL